MTRSILVLALSLVAALSIMACTASKNSNRNNTESIPGAELFAQHGWAIIGEATEGKAQMPEDFKIRSGHFPWRIFVDLSSDVGLDFSAYAGRSLRSVSFPINEVEGERLKHMAETYNFRGVVLLNEDVVVGAWIAYSRKDGTATGGNTGYSLTGKDLEQVTGLSWPNYLEKHRASH